MKPQQTTAFDRWLFRIFDRYLYEIILGALLLLSVVIRVKLTQELGISADFEYPISAWEKEYRELGFVEGMSRVIGDYYVPFNVMYAIIGILPFPLHAATSFVSCVFDYLCAWAVYRLLRMVLEENSVPDGRKKAVVAAALTLFLPCVFMNSALWKQCDSIQIFFALAATDLLLRKRYTPAFVFLGVSLSLKPQAVFFLPFFGLIYLLCREFTVFQFLWLPVMYLIAGLPAVLCKRGLRATYLTYYYLIKSGNGGLESVGMVANYPNFYVYGLDDFPETMAVPAIAMSLLVLGLSTVLAYRCRARLTRTRLLFLLAWQLWSCCMLMPSMHDRYDYPAVILFSVLMLVMPKQCFLPAVVLNIGSYITYMKAAIPVDVSMSALTAVYIAAWFLTTWTLVHELLRKDRRSPAA